MLDKYRTDQRVLERIVWFRHFGPVLTAIEVFVKMLDTDVNPTVHQAVIATAIEASFKR